MKRTLAVLLILAGLGAYVYFVEIKGKQKEQAAEKKSKRVVPYESADIDRLTIVNAAGRIELVKRGEAWHLAAPVSAPADESAVSSLVSSLTSAETKETIAGAADLAGFGLEPPKAGVTVNAGGKQVEVLIGRKSPVSQDLYVMRKGEPAVLLVAGGLDAGAERKADDYRDKRLFTFEAGAVTAVTIVEGKDTLVLERSGNTWAITQPRRIAADENLAQGLAADLANLRATRFVAENASAASLAAEGLKPPAASVTAKLTSGTTAVVRFGRTEGSDRSAAVEGRPQITRIADWSVRNLLKKPNDLRERRLFPVAAENIQRLEFRTGDRMLVFQRAAAGWSVSDGNSSNEGKTEAVDELVTALTDYRANEFHEATPASLKDRQLAPPLRTVTAYDVTGKKLAALSFGREEDGWAVWAQTEDKAAAAKASNDFVKNKWPSAAAAFYATPVTP